MRRRGFRPHGWARSFSHGLSPIGVAAGGVALEREAGMRLRRLRDAAGDRLAQRLRPTRPRMRALGVAPGGRIRWRDVPVPRPPGPGEALVHPIAVSTCDLDRALALGATPFALPLHLGHECVAEVVEVGDGVGVSPGERVVVPFQISCGSCAACRDERPGNCAGVPPLSMYGFGLAGGHWGGAVSDLLAVPFADAMLVPLPAGVEPAEAVGAADNISDAHRHIAPHLPALIARGRDPEVLIVSSVQRRSPYSASVPMYAGQIALALGARRVRMVDARARVRAQAERLGLEALDTGDLDPRERAPLVVDASAGPRGLALALRMTAEDGICSSLGGLHVKAAIPTGEMFGRNATLHIGRTHARAEMPKVLDLIASGKIRPGAVTTALDDFDDAPRALRAHMLGDATKTVLVER